MTKWLRVLPAPFALSLAAVFPVEGSAADLSAAVPPAVQAYAESNYEVMEIKVFEGDFTGDNQPDAIAFIYYAFVGGNSFGLDVSLFENLGETLVHMRAVEKIFGTEPRDVIIGSGLIEVTTTTLKPGDPRCCPTGETRHRIKL
jgi:hypothetical protein